MKCFSKKLDETKTAPSCFFVDSKAKTKILRKILRYINSNIKNKLSFSQFNCHGKLQ